MSCLIKQNQNVIIFEGKKYIINESIFILSAESFCSNTFGGSCAEVKRTLYKTKKDNFFKIEKFYHYESKGFLFPKMYLSNKPNCIFTKLKKEDAMEFYQNNIFNSCSYIDFEEAFGQNDIEIA